MTPHFPAQVVPGDDHDVNLFFLGERVGAVLDWGQAAFSLALTSSLSACFMFRYATPITTSGRWRKRIYMATTALGAAFPMLPFVPFAEAWKNAISVVQDADPRP